VSGDGVVVVGKRFFGGSEVVDEEPDLAPPPRRPISGGDSLCLEYDRWDLINFTDPSRRPWKTDEASPRYFLRD
jgi:hypothetical protein